MAVQALLPLWASLPLGLWALRVGLRARQHGPAQTLLLLLPLPLPLPLPPLPLPLLLTPGPPGSIPQAARKIHIAKFRAAKVRPACSTRGAVPAACSSLHAQPTCLCTSLLYFQLAAFLSP